MPIALNDIALGKKLGNGCFGEVHQAQVTPHGVVAVKTMKCSFIATFFGIPSTNWPTLRDQIFSEAVWLREGEHAHVVRVHGVGYSATRDEGYIVTELCDGGSVAKAIERGPLPLEVVHRYTRDALLGLEALHGRGMIHRDLKPPNILIKAGNAKLSDFGLVTDRLVAGYASHAGYTEFLAPEVHTSGLTSTASDVWAMGLTVYRMLSGEPWYSEFLKSLGVDKATDPAAIKRLAGLVTAGGFAKRLTFLPHVPESWRRFVRKAMHDDTAERFDNGARMLTAMSSRQLPSVPSWGCTQTATQIIWRRTNEGRDTVVTWTRGAKHDALAELHPAPGTGGKVRVLRRVNNVSAAKARETLQAFFRARTS